MALSGGGKEGRASFETIFGALTHFVVQLSCFDHQNDCGELKLVGCTLCAKGRAEGDDEWRVAEGGWRARAHQGAPA